MKKDQRPLLVVKNCKEPNVDVARSKTKIEVYRKREDTHRDTKKKRRIFLLSI